MKVTFLTIMINVGKYVLWYISYRLHISFHWCWRFFTAVRHAGSWHRTAITKHCVCSQRVPTNHILCIDSLKHGSKNCHCVPSVEERCLHRYNGSSFVPLIHHYTWRLSCYIVSHKNDTLLFLWQLSSDVDQFNNSLAVRLINKLWSKQARIKLDTCCSQQFCSNFASDLKNWFTKPNPFESIRLANQTDVFSILLLQNVYYTVNHKKRDILFLTITLVSLNRFL